MLYETEQIDSLFLQTIGYARTYKAATEAFLKITNCGRVSISQIFLMMDPANKMLLFMSTPMLGAYGFRPMSHHLRRLLMDK